MLHCLAKLTAHRKARSLARGLAASFCVVALFLFCAQGASAAGSIVFCKSIAPDHSPVEPAETFSTTTVSWVAAFGEPCGVPQVIFSIYRRDDTKAEEVLYREELAVRPTWNLFTTKDMQFPGDGTYILAFNRPDGTMLAEGTVAIQAQIKPEEAPPLPEKIEMEGTTLEALFNKFKMSAQPVPKQADGNPIIKE